MAHDEHAFLFNPLNSKQPQTARKVHIRRLFDILHLCVQRHDWQRARRAWTVLLRCKEVDWKTMWKMSLLLLGRPDENTDFDPPETDSDKVNFLTVMMRQHPEERESILKELVLHLIQCNMHRRAMEELDLYLPSYPYQDNPVLHVYAGLIALYLAQPANDMSEETTYGPCISPALHGKNGYMTQHLAGQGWDASYLRNAQAHLERAQAIDPSNIVAAAFLSQLSGTTRAAPDRDTPDSDDEKMEVEEALHNRKRIKA